MRPIDLHAHTDRSDGSLRPAALVALARDIGLGALAITDHDTTAAFDEGSDAGRSMGVEVLLGVEITARFPGRAMHLLAYGFERREACFVEMLDEIIRGRELRNPRILDRLAALGVPVTMDEVRAEAVGDVIGRPHIALAMRRRGYVPDTKAAFSRYLKDGGPAFVASDSVEPAEVIATVRRAGGTTVVAHPKQLRVETPGRYETLVAELAAAGLGGIEVDHPSQKADERAMFRRLADAHGLVSSGGSDFHGESKPDIRLGVGDGTIAMGYETYEALLARCDAAR
jgi:predicted metal-dependent phosphoesterase TrpH